MRKFLLSGSLIAAVLGVRSVVKETRNGPRDWALALMWVSWGLNVAIAVAGILREAKAKELAEVEEAEGEARGR